MGESKLTSFPTDDALAQSAAAAWVDEVEAANRTGALHAVALSGGRIAKKFYAAVVQQAVARQVSFDRVHFFWGDERCVPPDDPDSNYLLALRLLFGPLKIEHEQVHRIHGENPIEAPKLAAQELGQVVAEKAGGQPALDLIFLGMGEDGHVASLFPGESEVAISSPAVYRMVMAAKPPPQRVTLGYPALAAARQVWVLASGAGKEGALRESLRPGGKTPLARVLAARSQTRIFSDISL